MEKDIEFIELFELYKGLLTKTQVELFNAHMCYDLSLGEVAEEFRTSRQSVSDAIKKVKNKLTEYESILHLKEKNDMLLILAENTKDEKLKEVLKGIVEL